MRRSTVRTLKFFAGNNDGIVHHFPYVENYGK